MKTDKFDDAIRRKLESIEPPFRERDWSHMQAFMHHHGFPPAWVGASQWLVPMAAAAAVTGLIVSTVWQFQTNQQLNQSVQSLSQTVARLESTQAKLINSQHRADTVYVTNFTKSSPSTSVGTYASGQLRQSAATIQGGEQYAGQPFKPVVDPNMAIHPEASLRKTNSPQTGSEAPYPSGSNRPVQRYQQPSTPQAMDRVARTDLPGDRRAAGQNDRSVNSIDRIINNTDRSVNKEAINQTPALVAPAPDPTQRMAKANRPRGQNQQTDQTTHWESVKDQPVAESNQTNTTSQSADRRETTDRTGSGLLPVDNQSVTRQTETIALLNNRPLVAMVTDSAYYVESLARRTRRIRSLMPAAVPILPTTTTPADVTGSRPILAAVRFRLGASAEFGSIQRMLGAYSEVLIGKHWALGVGLNQVHLQGGRFDNDDQFDRITKDDFRRLYAQGIDPMHPIINIDRQFSLWQLPVNVSYRVPLGKGFTLAPAVGMDFSLSVQENTTFTYRRGPYEIQNVPGLPPSRPCAQFDTYTLALGAEKSWKHVVIQAGPVLSTPTRSLPDPVNPISLSLRTRLLFQF